MSDHVVVSIEVGVDVVDANALVAAALDRYEETKPDNTPADHFEEFKALIRSDPATAVHQLLVPRVVVDEIPGVRYVGSTATQRLSQANEPLSWRRGDR
jgi:hypothetical protein